MLFRESSSLHKKDETINDLEEQVCGLLEIEFVIFQNVESHLIDNRRLQIRDLTVYIQAQRTLGTMSLSDDIKEGTVLPVPVKQQSSSSHKRRAKPLRKQ